MGALATEVIDTGEKRDGRGRRIASIEQRRELVAGYERSGLTQKAFAGREGVSYHTFTYWVQQARRLRQSERPCLPAVRFAEVRLPKPVTSRLLEVQLPDGTLVRGTTATELAQLVRALRT